jgi:hypothetical protein
MADLSRKAYVNDNKYFISPIGKVTKDSIKTLIQTSMETLRKNRDGTKAILKHAKNDTKPTVFNVCSIMTHAEALKEMDKPEWSQGEESIRG